jgi:hypothetical protein
LDVVFKKSPGRCHLGKFDEGNGRYLRLEDHWEKVHVIIQGSVDSEEVWDSKDRYPRAPIFLIG